ncbi:MAG: DUF433 domain-containing protein [Pyrinomonadaceae bacterium]|nr:DUF433 domain-containing protein [Pyrinomonadaceae bacterium]
MHKEYIEHRDGGYWIAGKRISLDSVVYAFRRGAAPESILRSYPLLTLEEVYGAITFYLGRQAEIDQYLAENEAEYERQRQQERAADPEFYKNFSEAREKLRQGSVT